MKKSFYAVCVFLSLLLFALFSTSQGVLLTPIVNFYSLTESSQGAPNATMNIGCTIALLSSLFVMGRISKPKLLVIFTVTAVLFILPAALKPSFTVFTILYLCIGISLGYLDTLSSSAIADLFTGKRGSVMMGILHAMFGIGGMLTPILIGSLMDRGLAWNYVYLIIGGLGILLCLYIIPVGRNWIKNDVAVKTVAPKLSRDTLRRFLGDRENLTILLATVLYAFYFGGITVWTGRFIEHELDGGAMGAISLSLFWLGITLCRTFSPMLKITPLRYLQVSCIIGAAVLVPGVLSGNAYIMGAAAALTALLAGAYIPMTLHLCCDRFRENTMLVTTAVLLCVYGGQALGPALIGKIESLSSIAYAMLTTPVALALSGIALLTVKEMKNS